MLTDGSRCWNVITENKYRCLREEPQTFAWCVFSVGAGAAAAPSLFCDKWTTFVRQREPNILVRETSNASNFLKSHVFYLGFRISITRLKSAALVLQKNLVVFIILSNCEEAAAFSFAVSYCVHIISRHLLGQNSTLWWHFFQIVTFVLQTEFEKGAI